MGLDLIDLTLRVERSFGVPITAEDFWSRPNPPGGKPEPRTTVGDLLEIILQKRKQLPLAAYDAGLREVAVAEVQRAVARLLGRPVETLAADTELDTLLEKPRRRAHWKRLARLLGKHLPELTWDGISYRAVLWSCITLFTALAATVTVPWMASEANHPWKYGLSIVMALAVAWMIGAIAGGLFAALPWWLRRRLPPHVQTLEDLGVAVLGLNRARFVQEYGDRGDADVWPSLRIIVADVLDVPLERVTAEADLVRDLGAD